VPAAERGEVGDDRLDVVAAGEQHEAPHRTERVGPLADPLVELGVGHHPAAVEQGGRVAEPREREKLPGGLVPLQPGGAHT
jgi:hypothetical protein